MSKRAAKEAEGTHPPGAGPEQPTVQPEFYKFYRDMYEAAKELPQAQAAKFCLAALSLFYDGVEPDNLPVRVRFALSGWRGRIERARAASIKRLSSKAEQGGGSGNFVEKSGENRAKTGTKPKQKRIENGIAAKPVAGETHPTTAQLTPTDKRCEKGDMRNNDTYVSAGIPPSVEEVEAYFAYLEGSKADAKAFIDYNDARGWMIGSSKAVDWRPLARRWMERKRDHSRKGGISRKRTGKHYDFSVYDDEPSIYSKL